MVKIIKTEIVKTPSREYTARLIRDDFYDGDEYRVEIKSGIFSRVLTKCSLKASAEQIFKQAVQEWSKRRS